MLIKMRLFQDVSKFSLPTVTYKNIWNYHYNSLSILNVMRKSKKKFNNVISIMMICIKCHTLLFQNLDVLCPQWRTIFKCPTVPND
jgi:hypothetical protein